jgi:AcrR family transcriptional regulator
VLWLVGERLGATITAAVDPAAASAAFVEPALQMVPSKPNQPLAAIDLDAVPNVSSPMLDDGSTETQLIQAAADVISSSGVASASMARIARKAQVSTGTIYPRFENITDLVDAAFELSISAVIEQNFALLANTNFEPDDFGLFVMAGLGPKRSVWRNFRVEIHLEARLRDALKVRMTQNLHESNARVAEKIRQYDLRDLVVGPIPYLIHNIGVGFAILQNAGIELLKIDHRLLTRELVAAVLRLAK